MKVVVALPGGERHKCSSESELFSGDLCVSGSMCGMGSRCWVFSQESKDGSKWGLRWSEFEGNNPIEGWSVNGRQAILRDFWDILKAIPFEKNNEDLNMEDLPGFSPMISADEQARIDAEAREKAESAAMDREAEKDYYGALDDLDRVIPESLEDATKEHVTALILRGKCYCHIARAKRAQHRQSKYYTLAQKTFRRAEELHPTHREIDDLIDEVETALSSLSTGVVSGGASGAGGAAGAAGSEHSDPSSSGTPIAPLIAHGIYSSGSSEDLKAAQAALKAGEFEKAWGGFDRVIKAEESDVLAEAYCGRGECSLRLAPEMPSRQATAKALSAAIKDFDIAVDHNAVLKRAYSLKAEAEAALRPLRGALPSGTAGARDDATVLSMRTT